MQMIYRQSNNAVQGLKSCSCHTLDASLVMLQFGFNRNLCALENMTRETVNRVLLKIARHNNQ